MRHLSSHHVRPIVAVAAAAFAVACGPPTAVQDTPPVTTQPTPPTPTVAVGDQVAAHFLETVTGSGLRRWDTDRVTFAWSGTPSDADRRVLVATFAALDAVDGLPELVGDGEPADVPIHVVPPAEWPDALGDLFGAVHYVHASGLAGTRFVGGRLTAAAVVVDATSDQTLRSRTLVHELFHALGVGYHSCPTGVGYGGPDATPGWAVPEIDLAILRLTYDRRLPAGADADELRARLAVQAGTGPGCDPAVFETVVGPSGGLLWCRTTDEPVRPCQAAVDNPFGGPVPDAPVVAWLSGDTISDFDPSRYRAFSFEGRRVLCELPAVTARARCQETDGSSVDRVDWWTAGEFLYRDP
jgi:hypothetical protein